MRSPKRSYSPSALFRSLPEFETSKPTRAETSVAWIAVNSRSQSLPSGSSRIDPMSAAAVAPVSGQFPRQTSLCLCTYAVKQADDSNCSGESERARIFDYSVSAASAFSRSRLASVRADGYLVSSFSISLISSSRNAASLGVSSIPSLRFERA